MKTFCLLTALLFSTPIASAATPITLDSADCMRIRVCPSVPNDAGVQITLSANVTGQAVYLTIDSVTYSSPTGASNSIVGLYLYAADGSFVMLDASFGQYRECVRSGRGQHCYTHYVLSSGTISA